MYSLRHKLYTNYTLNPTLRRFKPYTASVQNPTQRRPNPTQRRPNPTQNPARNIMLKFEKPFPSGRGWGRLPLQKSNNFERFFSDLTLTFLTFGNTFRLPILPIRRLVFLSLPQIFLCLPLIFLCLPLIFPGCASKIPDFKGKVTKKGGSRGSSHISVQI